MAETLSDEEATEIVSQDSDLVYTGSTCSQLSLGHSQGKDVSKERSGESALELDTTCTDKTVIANKAHSDSKESTTNELGGDSQESTQPLIPSQDIESLPRSNGFAEEQTYQKQDSIYSQESTQPVIPSQEIEFSAPSRNDSTLNQDLCSSPRENVEINKEPVVRTLSKTEKSESNSPHGHSQDDASSLSSISQTVSSSSSSKRPTDSDETDDMGVGSQQSQDLFGSQSSFCSSQPNVISVSRSVPTFQFSGDIPSSQGYEGFQPNLFNPSSSTTGITSTPLKGLSKTTSGDSKGVIALSDEEDIMKLSEKRKLSDDSSDEPTKPDLKKIKRQANDSRPSIMIVEEINKPRKPSTPDSEDPSASSQGFHLHLSQTDPDITECQESENIKTINEELQSWKSHSDMAPILNDSRNTEHDTSIVQIEDDAEEIQCVSSKIKSKFSEPEIIIETHSPHHLSKSGEIEVLSPDESNRSVKATSILKSGHKVETSSFQNGPGILTPHINRSLHAVVKQHSLGEAPVHDLDNSKENIQPGKQTSDHTQEFDGDFLFTFTCTYKVSCKAAVDTQKKEITSNSITSFEVLDSRTVQRRDSSPSAVESNGGSPGSIASCPGPFPLQPSHLTRLSLMSTTSSSSVGSSVSHSHRQLPGQRGRVSVPVRNNVESPIRQQEMPCKTPWNVLLSQYPNVMADSGADLIEKWSSSTICNLSSDDSKTVADDKKSSHEDIPEDDNEGVSGVPPLKRLVLNHSKRAEPCRDNPASSVQNNPSKEEVHIKSGSEPSLGKRKRGRPPKTPVSSTKKKGATPIKINPKGDQSSMPDDSSLSSGSFVAGSQVFAKYDKGYYPGKIDSVTPTNQYIVTFYDGETKVLNQNKILAITTFEIGQEVLAKDGNDYGPGVVTDVTPRSQGDDLFTVKLNSSDHCVDVSISDICLLEKHVKRHVLSSSTPSSCPKRTSSSKTGGGDRDIIKNLDTLHDLPSKRVRTPKGSHSTVNSPSRPGPSSTARQLIPEGNGSTTADDEPLATPLSSGPNVVVAGVDVEMTGFETADPLARKGQGVKNKSKKALKELENKDVLKKLGPIPPKGCKIFAGYFFLITQADVKLKHRRDSTTDSDGHSDLDEHRESECECGSDSECFKFAHLPMVKGRLSNQIAQGGGLVLKDWTEIEPRHIKNTYVVSNRPCLTPIFLHCVVRGVKGVNADYIIHCCKQTQEFSSEISSNLLPAGYSQIRKKFITWEEHKSLSPLRGDNILVVGSPNFKYFWDDLLKQTGATVSTVKSSEGMKNVTLLLSENPCPDNFLKLAQYLDLVAGLHQGKTTHM